LPATTLRENLSLNSSMDEATLRSVLQQAGVDEFLARLPQGLDTSIGDGGMGLSVGQAQRVAVARALLKPAQLLLLDEPGSGLDSQSEQHVLRALNQAATQQTTLMITHQLHDLASWDEVWVMQSGQLVQQGQWQQLIAQDGPLRAMVQHRQQEIV
jgi:ABC-type transport system involved in cytochrome bd biosynthesis, ATPase and permease components